MSVESTAATESLANAAPIMGDDDALAAIWDQNQRDNGAVRGDDGKFASPQPEEVAVVETGTEPPLEGEGGGEVEQNADSTPAVPSAPLPASWKNGVGKPFADLEPIWAKLTDDERAALSKHQGDLHTRMSDQGRQLSGIKPLFEVIDRHRDLYENKVLPSGEKATAPAAVELLLNAHRNIQKNPVEGILQLADMYKVRQHIAAALGSPAEQPNSETKPQPAGITSAEVEAMVTDKLNRRLSDEAAQRAHQDALRAAEEDVNRFSKDKPFYAEIPESKMAAFITLAFEDLGETATRQAVFDLAYDMAVHADPTLRAKASAAEAAKRQPAAQPDPKRTADAKRANAINLPSTATGKARELTEDEVLAQAYDAAQKD